MHFRLTHLHDIMAARKKELKRGKAHAKLTKSQSQHGEQNEGKIRMILKRDHFGSEQKNQVIQQIQCRYRFIFGPRFPLENVSWRIVYEATILEKTYDPNKQSYFILGGKITMVNENAQINNIPLKQQLFGQRGLGMLFGENNFKKWTISAQNAVILSIPHHSYELSEIERQAVMTRKQQKIALKQFKLFDSVDSFQKYFLPFIQPARYSKGQYIYKKGEEAKQLLLIIEGEIALETQVYSHLLIKPQTTDLADLVRKRKQELFMTSQVLSQGCYFGQQQIISSDIRRHNARCNSINCLLLTLPTQKVIQLMSEPSVLESLLSTSRQRVMARNNKVQIYNKVKLSSNNETDYHQLEQKYENFKVRVQRHLTQERQQLINKISLRKTKKKIMHGHCVKLGEHSPEGKQEQFSMLKVNQQTYSQTIKRFRHSLNQLDKYSQQKQKSQLQKGRSLQDVWHSLRLESVLQREPTNSRVHHENCNGKELYQAYHKLNKRRKRTHSCQPKSFVGNWKLKTDYIRYLDNLQ